MTYMRKVILCALFCSFAAMPAKAETCAMVSDSATINAPVKEVWDALKVIRRSDPAHRKVISSGGGDYIVEERFEGIPIIGEAVCTYKEHEIPMKKLQYQMVKSDKLKAFEGEWELTPTCDGKQTIVKLSSRIDAGIRIPFAGKITRDQTAKSIAARLGVVRDIASRTQVAAVESAIKND